MPVRPTVCRAALRVLVLAMAAATPADDLAAVEAPAAMVLFDFETAVDTARIHAQNATAAVADRDGGHVLRVTAGAVQASPPSPCVRPAARGTWRAARASRPTSATVERRPSRSPCVSRTKGRTIAATPTSAS